MIKERNFKYVYNALLTK